MPKFTAKDFKDMLQTDIWVIEQILVFPHDPPQRQISEYDEKTGIATIGLVTEDSISVPLQQEGTVCSGLE